MKQTVKISNNLLSSVKVNTNQELSRLIKKEQVAKSKVKVMETKAKDTRVLSRARKSLQVTTLEKEMAALEIYVTIDDSNLVYAIMSGHQAHLRRIKG